MLKSLLGGLPANETPCAFLWLSFSILLPFVVFQSRFGKKTIKGYTSSITKPVTCSQKTALCFQNYRADFRHQEQAWGLDTAASKNTNKRVVLPNVHLRALVPWVANRLPSQHPADRGLASREVP